MENPPHISAPSHGRQRKKFFGSLHPRLSIESISFCAILLCCRVCETKLWHISCSCLRAAAADDADTDDVEGLVMKTKGTLSEEKYERNGLLFYMTILRSIIL